jgi:predicted MPP superfamily phosphohydrolase
VLCGHLHGGQICLPTPWGKLRLAHGVHRFREGIYHDGETTIVVTRGLGTTLVPFRVAARPEVSLLRLHPA